MLCALPRAVAVKDRDGAMPQPPLYSAQNILRKEETHIAIFHCTIKLVQRSKGKSVVAAAAYRSGTKLVNEWDGMTHDYTRKGGVVHAEIMLPAHAPPEFQDRAILWNSVEQIEKSKDSQLAREVEVALPVELSREQQLSLVRTYVKDNFVDNGMCADFAIHDRDTGNPHAHILLTVRPLKENGEWGAKCRKPASRYESIRKLREQAALYNLLATNGITTMQQLHEKVDAMNAQYYKLRGEIVSAERRIATLEERLDMFEKYEKNKAVQRQYVKVKPAKREQFEQSYRAELTLYKAAVRYLENLKTEGEPVTPKKWRSEVESLTAQKNLQYQEMRAMREEIKAVEKLKKAAERLEKDAQAKEKKRNEPER